MQRTGKRWIVTEKTIDMETLQPVSEKGYWYDGPVDSCDPATIMMAIGLALTAGTTAYQFANKPGAPKVPTTPPVPTQTQMSQSQQAQRAAVGQQLPNVQASTSGFTNPAYAAMMAQLLSGTAGQPGAGSSANQAVNQAFGLTPGLGGGLLGGGGAPGTPRSFTPAGATNAALPGSETGFSDFANQFFRG